MIEGNFLFRKVSEIPQTQVVTCQPWQDIHSVALAMMEAKASGAVVCDEKIPIGIITDRDFRDLFATRRDQVANLKAEDVMRAPLVRIDRENYVFEAVYRMTRNGIHHLVTVDGDGEFTGVISDDDLMNVHTASPLYFKREITGCETMEEVRAVNGNVKRIISFAMDAGARTRDMVRLIAMFNDAITRRVIHILKRDRGVELPEGAAFLALGSEGRKEQTLRTDQDNALLYADDLGPEEIAQAERFAVEVVDALHFIGVPYCPGGTMASNPRWRKSLSGWLEQLERWIESTTPESLVNFGMLQDFRALHGDKELVEGFRLRFNEKVAGNKIFLSRIARNVSRFPPALGFFDRFLLEKKGEHRGALNLKKAGIFALTEGVTLLAMETGAWGETTWDKLDHLAQREAVSLEAIHDIELGFTFLMWLRLKRQLKESLKEQSPSDFVIPSTLSAIDEARLTGSLQAVKRLLKILKDRYHTDYLR